MKTEFLTKCHSGLTPVLVLFRGEIQSWGLIRGAALFAGVVKGKQVSVGLDVNGAVGDDRSAVNRRAEIGFADDHSLIFRAAWPELFRWQFLAFVGCQDDEVAVFVAD